IFRSKAKKKNLVITLSEGESILASIKAAMKEHSLKEATIVDVNGKIMEAKVNYFERNRYVSKDLKCQEVVAASGSFKISGDELWGGMNVTLNKKKPLTVKLVQGKAAEGLEIKLLFYEIKIEN
ncbi:MAG: DUF296 domain-containing protein, partial [Candidatus Diapherotrites archaeon]